MADVPVVVVRTARVVSPSLGGVFRAVFRTNAKASANRLLLAAALSASPLHAQSNNVRITQLSDVAFGSIVNVSADATMSQSVCVYAHTATNGYRITASGSGPGGSFDLASGSHLLNYDVQWSQTGSQSSGTQLSPNVALTGLTSSAAQQTCNSGPATSASLILILRGTQLSNARAGSYAGTLTLLVGPE